MIRRASLMAMILVVAANSGCAVPLPTQPWIDHDHAVQFVSQRMNAVKTLSANCVLVLKEPSRGSITFEGALAIQPPAHLRIQCWKFSTKVMDLTMNPDGFWIDMKRRAVPEGDDPLVGLDAERLAEAWMLVMGEMLGTQPVVIDDRGGSTFEARIEQPERHLTIVYSIDRRTQTAQWCRFLDADGATLHFLRFKQYRLFDDIAWPTQLVGESPAGSFLLNLDDVEINGPLGTRAFIPPRNAVRKN